MADEGIDLAVEGFDDFAQIGAGGFAVVYRASQPAFQRTVAIKVLTVGELDSAKRHRFDRECQVMGLLSAHPGIVAIYDAGFTAQGRPYLVMEFMERGSVADRLANDGPLRWEEAAAVGVRLAGALETAHQSGIVHRDVKPANVLVSRFGDTRLADFGIARISGGIETQSGIISASVAHAAPEVLGGARPLPASDIYSIGSTIYELLAGSPAFTSPEDESIMPLIGRIATQLPPPLTDHGVPNEFWAVIERAMAKDPEQRQASARLVGVEIQAAQRALGVPITELTIDDSLIEEVSAATVVTEAPPPQVEAVSTQREVATADAGASGPTKPLAAQPVAEPEPRRGSGRLWWGAAVVCAVIIAIAVAAVAMSGGGDDPTPASDKEPAAEPSDEPSDEPAADAAELIMLEAEDGHVTSPMVASTDRRASGAAFVSSPERDDGVVRIEFEVSHSDRYWIWGRVSTALPPTSSTDGNSIVVSIDDEASDIWDFFEEESQPVAGWRWERVSVRCGGGPFNHLCDPWWPNLTTGRHDLIVSGREPDSALDAIVITNDPNFRP